jgi:hypothetical protein
MRQCQASCLGSRRAHAAAIQCRAASSLVQPVKRDAALLDFVSYCNRSKIQFSKCRPDVGEGGRGVYATTPIRKGETLVSVPRSASLVLGPGERSPSPKIPEATWERLRGTWWAQLALKLLLAASEGSKGSMREFVAALPQQPVDLPATWTGEELGELQYAYLEGRVAKEQQLISELWAVCRPCVSGMGLDEARFRWALTCIRSRSFEGPHFKGLGRALAWKKDAVAEVEYLVRGG